MKHFNELTPAEAERLACLLEECAEVQQIVGKILRHGYESYNPNDAKKLTNRWLLEMELGDLLAVVSMMSLDNEDISETELEHHKQDKLKRIQKYLHHQKRKSK
jgi:NTP pyrophosphatase (non-canonical NTP hydrolase)